MDRLKLQLPHMIRRRLVPLISRHTVQSRRLRHVLVHPLAGRMALTEFVLRPCRPGFLVECDQKQYLYPNLTPSENTWV